MRTRDFDYELPRHAIAQKPIEPRDAARLLVALDDTVEHRQVRDLPEMVGDGDVVVINETRVLPARLMLEKDTGGHAEVLLLERVGANAEWNALVRPGRRVPAGTTLLSSRGEPVVEVGEGVGGDGVRRVVLLVPETRLGDIGSMPLPPYIDTDLDDPERYQTVYAREHAASAAAPTAGLHLTDEVLDACEARGALVATVDLNVGLATFRPIDADRIEDHVMHEEAYSVAPETLEACRSARRVIAVGTTTVRALESAARGEPAGRTALFIHGRFDFRVVDVLLTNFHLPRSSLLVLLEAFAGPRWRELYAEALDEGYRFLSFGDAMLVQRARHDVA